MDKEVNFKINIDSQLVARATKEINATEKAAADLAAKSKKAMSDFASATKVAQKAAEDLHKAHGEKGKQTVEGLKKLGEGAVAFGRAIGLAGVATSENMEAAIRLFAKFESGVQIFKGVADSVEGARKIWLAYTSVSKAAAAADLAAAAAAAARAKAAAAGNVVGNAAGGAVAGAAGAAAGSGVGAAIIAALKTAGAAVLAFAVALAPLIAIAAAVSAALLGIVSIFSKDFREGLKNWITGHDELAEHQKKLSATYKDALTRVEEYSKAQDQKAEKEKAVREWSDKKTILEAQASGKTPAQVAAVNESLARQRFNEAQAKFNQADATFRNSNASGTSAAHGEMGVARGKASEDLGTARKELEDAIKAAAAEQSKEMQSNAQKVLKLEQEKLQANEKALQTAKDKTKEEEAGLKAVKDKVKQEQDRLKSAQERFVDMDPMERKKLVEAQQIAEKGGNLTKEQRDLLRGDNLNQDLIEKDTEAKLKGMNAGELAYFNRQNKKVGDAKQEEAAQEKVVKDAKAAEAKAQAAVVATEQAVAKFEEALAKVEQFVAGEPARVADAILKVIQQREVDVIRELSAKQEMDNIKTRFMQGASATAGAK